MIVSVFRSQRCLLLLQYHIRPTGSYTFSPPLQRYHAFRALFGRLVALSGAVGVGDCVQGANQIFLSILLLYHFTHIVPFYQYLQTPTGGWLFFPLRG